MIQLESCHPDHLTYVVNLAFAFLGNHSYYSGMSKERPPDGQKHRLLIELGILGIAEVSVGEGGQGERPLTAISHDMGWPEVIKFGFGARGFPFAYKQSTQPDDEERMLCTSEWDPSLVATRKTWRTLSALRSWEPGSYAVPAPPESKAPVFGSFDFLLTGDAASVQAAADLTNTAKGITEGRPYLLTVSHDSGLARDHLVVVDFPASKAGYAINQAEEVYASEIDQGGHLIGYLEAAPETVWPPGQWELLRAISNLTFSRMPTPSIIKIEL